MKSERALFETEFLHRCSSRQFFIPLGGVLIAGVLSGSVAAVLLEVFESQAVFPLFFSGIPQTEMGFLPCFSSILLNLLIGLIILFLLGVTAFGTFGVPVFLFCKGVSLAVGAISFLVKDDLYGLWRCTLSYTPAAAAGCFLLLLFAVRALLFSKGFTRAGLSPSQESMDFHFYFKDFMSFLCLAVIISAVGAFLALLCERIL